MGTVGLLSGLLLLPCGCGRSVTLQASSAKVIADLDKLQEIREKNQTAFILPVGLGIMAAHALSETREKGGRDYSNAAFTGGLVVGSIASTLTPSPMLGPFEMTDFESKTHSRKAEFSGEAFTAKIKVNASDAETTRMKVRMHASGSAEKQQRDEQAFLKALDELGR